VNEIVLDRGARTPLGPTRVTVLRWKESRYVYLFVYSKGPWGRNEERTLSHQILLRPSTRYAFSRVPNACESLPYVNSREAKAPWPRDITSQPISRYLGRTGAYAGTVQLAIG
jgi:hypothetical protein